MRIQKTLKYYEYIQRLLKSKAAEINTYNFEIENFMFNKENI